MHFAVCGRAKCQTWANQCFQKFRHPLRTVVLLCSAWQDKKVKIWISRWMEWLRCWMAGRRSRSAARQEVGYPQWKFHLTETLQRGRPNSWKRNATIRRSVLEFELNVAANYRTYFAPVCRRRAGSFATGRYLRRMRMRNHVKDVLCSFTGLRVGWGENFRAIDHGGFCICLRKGWRGGP